VTRNKHDGTKMKIVLAILSGVAILLPPDANSQYIYVDLSYKVVLNPSDGTRPFGTFTRVTDAEIDSAIAGMNQFLETYFRGCRVRRVDAITNVGGQNDFTGPSKWYSTDFTTSGNVLDDMETEAKANPVTFAWNASAINIYITAQAGNFSGGVCSLPSDDREIICVSGNAASDTVVNIHEIGHYFALCHTQGCDCNECGSDGDLGQCDAPEDDSVPDTLEDLACWDQNQIALHNFQTGYANLSASQQGQVDDVFFNLMSYHPTERDLLTEGQLDRWTIAANFNRHAVRSGRTVTVTPNASVADGIAAANPAGGDIVLIKPGNYNETLTITKSVTLRATRLGGVTIGAP